MSVALCCSGDGTRLDVPSDVNPPDFRVKLNRGILPALPRRAIVVGVVLLGAVLGMACGVVGCSSPHDSVEIQKELASSTTVQLNGETLSVSVVEAPKAARPGASPAEPSTAPPEAQPKRASKKPSVDVDIVLKRSKGISIGLVTDSTPEKNQNESKLFIPASITKLLTTAVALKELGRDFQFKTHLSFRLEGVTARNVVIVSDGDPTPGDPASKSKEFKAFDPSRIKKMVESIQKSGVSRIEGPIRLVSSDPRLNLLKTPEGVEKEDFRECFGSLASAFNFDENCASIRIDTRRGVSWTKISPADDRMMSRSIDFSSTAGDRNLVGIEAVIQSSGLLEGFRISALYSTQSPRTLLRDMPIADGSSWFGAQLLKELRVSKIDIRGVEVINSVSASDRNAALSFLSEKDRVAYDFKSSPLSEIIEATNKPSDNFLANAIFRAVGRKAGSGAAASGVAFGDVETDLNLQSRSVLMRNLESWLKANGSFEFLTDFNFVEGAGLSKANRASPRALMAVLRQLRSEPFFSDLWNSLAIAGRDGSLSDRMKQTIAEGVVRGKTGTMAGYYQLVGYIPTSTSRGVEYLPFVILTETSERNRDQVRDFQDRLVVKMLSGIQRTGARGSVQVSR